MKKIVTIATGTELMLGKVQDQDFYLMAGWLSEVGIPLHRHVVVGDDDQDLKSVFSACVRFADIIILTGGLGPTTDDLTREVTSQVLNLPLKSNSKVLKDIQKKFHTRNLPLPKIAKAQALILKGAQVIWNKVGTAPGMFLEYQGKQIFLLPGPPYEMGPMFERDVLPRVKKFFGKGIFEFCTFKTYGIVESSVQELMNRTFRNDDPFLRSLGYVSAPSGVSVRVAIPQGKKRIFQERLKKIERALQPWLYGENNNSLHEVIANLLIKKNKQFTVAESCTGGLFSQRLTSVSGVSKIFRGGVVSYSNDSKKHFLGVDEKSLKKYGAVSEKVALEMAQGVCKEFKADLGLSITGIAGPEGGSPQKPVGLVWIGLSDGKKTTAKSFHFSGDRDTVRFKATQAAFDCVRRFLK
ncbi:MAG: competence/damage-inducible protein A [Chlamydiae bacterium]|nr:competence/damage-inducible protein A [Chlamydiota bacterium]MBI3266908.1 competence/damage-inducible protein A [Chlamydiota bacterium]